MDSRWNVLGELELADYWLGVSRRFGQAIANPMSPQTNSSIRQKNRQNRPTESRAKIHPDIAQEDEMKQSFDSQLRAIQALVDQVQTSPGSTDVTHPDGKETPVSTGAALLTWLKGPDVTIGEARRVVSQLWPKLSYDEGMKRTQWWSQRDQL